MRVVKKATVKTWLQEGVLGENAQKAIKNLTEELGLPKDQYLRVRSIVTDLLGTGEAEFACGVLQVPPPEVSLKRGRKQKGRWKTSSRGAKKTRGGHSPVRRSHTLRTVPEPRDRDRKPIKLWKGKRGVEYLMVSRATGLPPETREKLEQYAEFLKREKKIAALKNKQEKDDARGNKAKRRHPKVVRYGTCHDLQDDKVVGKIA